MLSFRETHKTIKIIRAVLVLILAVQGCQVPSQTKASETLRIVDNGQTRSVVVFSNTASQQIKDAAKLLASYLKASSGTEVPVVHKKAALLQSTVKIRIHVGPSKYVDKLDLRLESLDDDGYVLDGIDKGNFVIVGPTDWGTEFGVYEFLERYLGVRWLMPGKDGDDIPVCRVIDIPVEEVRQEPVFISRLMSGLTTHEMHTWERRNRSHGRVNFHHNLGYLFPPSKYGKTHPEFFPVYDGKRYIPAAKELHTWQPCFSAEGIVDEAVKNIGEYFETYPEETSYSLGMNDTQRFCQCQRCLARYPEKKNFLGFVDVSDIYFQWCNAVVERVLKKYPDKWFGMLAYHNLIEPPDSRKVHPRIIPFITYDRMKWCDPKTREFGQNLTKQWQKMSPAVGWYDYIYGTPYLLPRVYFHQMAYYLKFASEHGVKASYAEAYPNWGEGPKLYVAFKLLWDPNQDVDALLSEWYVRAVGKDAAPHLAEYYRHWEHFWTERIVHLPWFTKPGQWLGFDRPDYMAAVSEKDIVKSRNILETVVAKAGTKKQKARAILLLRAFEFYEASTIAYLGQLRAAETKVNSVEDALNVLTDGSRSLEYAEKRRRLVYEEIVNNPVLKHSLLPDRFGDIAGREWGAKLFNLAEEWAGDEAVKRHLRELARESKSEIVRKKAGLMLRQGGAEGSDSMDPAGNSE